MAPLRVDTDTIDTPTMDRTRYLDILDKATRIVEMDETDNMEAETDFVGESAYGPQFLSSNRVQFAVAIKRHEIMSLDDFTEKEIKKCWYSSEDKQKMHSKKDKIVERIEKSRPVRKGMTYRGLECWTTAGGTQLDENIARAVDAVMDEQEAQWNAKFDNYDGLAAASLAVTGGSGQRAREIALDDEREARMSLDFAADDSESVTDDENVSSFAHLVAKKRDERSERKKKNRRKSKPKRQPSKRQHAADPPGKIQRGNSEKASDMLMKMRNASRKVKTLKV